jgi:hypothetical protein
VRYLKSLQYELPKTSKIGSGSHFLTLLAKNFTYDFFWIQAVVWGHFYTLHQFAAAPHHVLRARAPFKGL